MKKTFDCVEMKRQAAQQVQKQVQGKPVAEQLAFWKSQTEALRREQQAERERRIAE